MKHPKIAVALVAVGVLVAFAIFLFLAGFLRFSHPSSARYPVRGIDVSHHQGDIDWRQLRDSGIDFAYIKATEGADFRDREFAANWVESAEAGIARGAYHFFTFCTPGRSQADHFIEVVPIEERTLPPAVDIEFAGNCKNWSTVRDIRRELNVYLERVESAFGRKPILYVTRRSHGQIVAGHFPAYRLWVRGIFGRPWWVAQDDWDVWQFTDRGHLPGIGGFVDLNVFGGSRREFDALRSGPEAPGPAAPGAAAR